MNSHSAHALTPTELERIKVSIASANGLPNRFYTAAEAALAERDSVLTTGWTCIGFASDIAAGRARPLDLMGLPLLALRNGQNEVRVFHNVCRHRGHRLVTEPCAIQGSIRCPYHSWTYGLDGELRGTPHIGGHGVHEAVGFDKSSHGLHSVRSSVWMDMIFVNLSGDADDFADYIAPLLQRWQAFVGTNGLLEARPDTAQRLHFELGCNWKLAVENYCESYHLPWIHPGLNSYSKIEDHYNIVAGDWGSGQGSYVFEFTERAGIQLPRFRHWPQDKQKIAEYIALFPNVLLGLQNDHFYAIVISPQAENRTTETAQLYYIGEAADSEDYRAARQTMLEGWREVFLEDVGVCEGMQIGRASPAFDGGAFSPALDVATHRFHQWVAERLPVEA